MLKINKKTALCLGLLCLFSSVSRAQTPEARVLYGSAQGMLLEQTKSTGAFTELYEKAKRYDPGYQAALAEFESNRIQATATLFALAPELRLSETILENEASSRRTISLSQPLFSVDRIATFQETDARTALAQATLKVREYELVQRLLKALGDLVRGNEGLATNAARIKTLENEVERTKLEFSLGKGTVTDVRDTKVRLDQARASNLALFSKKETALATLESLIGEPVDGTQFKLKRTQKSYTLMPLEDAKKSGLDANPGLINAISAERLAELGALRARGAYLPQISFLVNKTERGGTSTNSSGLSFSLPLQAAGLISAGAAASNAKKASATRMQVEQQVKVDVQRFYTLVNSGLTESNIRLEAIESAELSVEANESSFKGGVRTRIDVLNSIQTLFQVNEDYVNSLVTLAENLIGFDTQTAVVPEKAAAEVDRLLFN